MVHRPSWLASCNVHDTTRPLDARKTGNLQHPVHSQHPVPVAINVVTRRHALVRQSHLREGQHVETTLLNAHFQQLKLLPLGGTLHRLSRTFKKPSLHFLKSCLNSQVLAPARIRRKWPCNVIRVHAGGESSDGVELFRERFRTNQIGVQVGWLGPCPCPQEHHCPQSEALNRDAGAEP